MAPAASLTLFVLQSMAAEAAGCTLHCIQAVEEGRAEVRAGLDITRWGNSILLEGTS